MEVYRIHMGKAKCAVDLGDGSERGEYVDQDYILAKMGRPHRSISLMYCYYPLDEGWPGRASVVHASPDVSFAWDYPYDDYFTYKGGLGGSTDGEPFNYMREIRQHGQDVSLTLTIDPHVSDEHLAAIGEDLKSFGRVFLRINHEATGNWFSFNKRCTYQEVADFFVRASRIIKEHAPNVQTIICIGGIEDLSKEEMERKPSSHRPFPQLTSGRWTSTWHCTGAGPMTWQNTAALLTAAALWRTPTRKPNAASNGSVISTAAWKSL